MIDNDNTVTQFSEQDSKVENHAYCCPSVKTN